MTDEIAITSVVSEPGIESKEISIIRIGPERWFVRLMFIVVLLMNVVASLIVLVTSREWVIDDAVVGTIIGLLYAVIFLQGNWIGTYLVFGWQKLYVRFAVSLVWCIFMNAAITLPELIEVRSPNEFIDLFIAFAIVILSVPVLSTLTLLVLKHFFRLDIAWHQKFGIGTDGTQFKISQLLIITGVIAVALAALRIIPNEFYGDSEQLLQIGFVAYISFLVGVLPQLSLIKERGGLTLGFALSSASLISGFVEYTVMAALWDIEPDSLPLFIAMNIFIGMASVFVGLLARRAKIRCR